MSAESPARTLRVAALALVALCAFGKVLPARADIWGYVDANGRAHMASEKLDERYQLFFKGSQRVGGPALSTEPAASAASGEVAPIVDTAGAESFRRSARFIRTTTQSNLKRLEPLIEKAAKAQRIDPALVKAVVAVESSFQPDAISPKGARGLMQVIPDTAERYGVVGDRRKSTGQKLLDPATNLRVGVSHLSNLLSMFASNLELALAAYNAGEGAVFRYAKKIPPFPETQEYVKLVKQFYASFLPPAKAKAEPVMLAANNVMAEAAPVNAPSTQAKSGVVTLPAATSETAPAASQTSIAALDTKSPVAGLETGPAAAESKPAATNTAASPDKSATGAAAVTASPRDVVGSVQ